MQHSLLYQIEIVCCNIQQHQQILIVCAVCSGGWNGLLDYNVHNSGGGWILALVGPLPGQYHGAAKRF